MAELYRSISWSQVTEHCGYALRFRRERAPRGPVGAARLVGRAVHAGIEYHLAFGDAMQATLPDGRVVPIDPVQRAVETAHTELDVMIEEAQSGAGLRWDEPHRLTRSNQVYVSDRGRMPSYEYALQVVGMEVMAWCARFPELRAVAVERRVSVDIGGDWRFGGYLDVELPDGGVVDVKTSTDAWDVAGKQRDKLEQAVLYQYGRLLEDGAPPAYFVFHVIPHAGLQLNVQLAEDAPPDVVPVEYDPAAIQVITVEFSETAVQAVLEHRVAPVVRTIEADAYVPRTDGWWCSERHCDFWALCPLGGRR